MKCLPNHKKESISEFLREIRAAIHSALNPQNIKNGFEKALIIDENNDIKNIEKKIQDLLKPYKDNNPSEEDDKVF
jgi:hypothetical protein